VKPRSNHDLGLSVASLLAPVLCAAVCLLLLHSALDVVARRAALKYAAPCCSRRWAASVPASRSRTGLSGGVAVMGRSGGGGGGPPGLALGERPWPLMKGECAGPFGVLAPSLDVAQRCLFRLINFIELYLNGKRTGGKGVL